MILCQVVGTVVATQKNVHLENNRLLIVQPIDLNGKDLGASMVALDRVDAGEGDRVIVMKEGGSARIIFQNPEIPLQSVVIAVVDDMDIDLEVLKENWPSTVCE